MMTGEFINARLQFIALIYGAWQIKAGKKRGGGLQASCINAQLLYRCLFENVKFTRA